ncbi:MAG TPA: shikimate dehydrogenase [Syntrophorhabdaceae bacterium]|nr:shikimate dehydrogenase [Syntrophorhabdaceae bacterium]HPP42674.1 shikimate dehydrogenase [Syntrophorhabdaceae bacterium]
MSEERPIFAVAGNPVLHSLSPVMFNNVFSSEGLDAVYVRILAKDAKEVAEIIRQIHIKGVNVTSPFKEEILKHIHIIHDEAKDIGAVNTLINTGNTLHGYNTDVYGIEGVFVRNSIDVFRKKAVIIGAGGAARAACFILKRKGADVTIINRTHKKAVDIAEDMGINAISLEDVNGCMLHADIIVQCLPRGINLIKPGFIKKGAFMLDANYSFDSPIVKGAQQKGYRACDGKDWLLYQAAASFKIFFGQLPPLHVMEKALMENTFDANKRRNISLVGFMGTGKSTIGKHLSELTGFELLDIDSEIEKRTHMSIREIFEKHHEGFFRNMEEEGIEEAVNLSKKIISCGGGAVISKKNRDALRKNSIVFWLWASPETVFKRIYNDKTRPLVSGIDNVKFLSKMIEERMFFYSDVADVVISTDYKDFAEIARMIYGEINKTIEG